MTTTDPIPHHNLIAVTGGIGSGKSVVQRIVTALGYPVYDCDSRARSLMATPAITAALADAFGPGIFDSAGALDRRALASIVFSDPDSLERLNSITHAAVRDDLHSWATLHCRRDLAFVETAILYQSGLDRMVGRVWEVTAPRDIRISRIRIRNGWTTEEITARIDIQDSFAVPEPHHDVAIIVNDGSTPVLPRIETLIAQSNPH